MDDAHILRCRDATAALRVLGRAQASTETGRKFFLEKAAGFLSKRVQVPIYKIPKGL